MKSAISAVGVADDAVGEVPAGGPPALAIPIMAGASGTTCRRRPKRAAMHGARAALLRRRQAPRQAPR